MGRWAVWRGKEELGRARQGGRLAGRFSYSASFKGADQLLGMDGWMDGRMATVYFGMANNNEVLFRTL